MNRLIGVLMAVLFLLTLVPAVLAETGRLLAPILARGAVGLILMLMAWRMVSLIRNRRYRQHRDFRPERRTDPWHF